ncbi:restriction endonuclease [Methanosarcina sp. UBA5]|uniref:restriction endonuclease n=1 Tax=Methanosarcina sp. UBA5 TaxID=1915593 RepID=UPI0025E99CB0|nr:restriction endonuclease [Methanosarcina sp. UBA5]
MKIIKRGKRRKQHRFVTGIFKIVLYLFLKLIKLLFSFPIYLLKAMWRLFSFSILLLKSMWLLFSFPMHLLYKFIKRLLKKKSKQALPTLAEIDEMNGYKFEEFMKHVYEQLGYSVYHTPFSGDQGADLILTSKRRTRIAVQVKRYSGKVSNSAVQEVVAAKGFYKCTEGIVVTNSYFTDSAKQLAKANFIDLVDRNELEKMINTVLN